MRSALKRDLDVNAFARPAEEGSAPAEGQENLPKAMRSHARPRIVETEARKSAAEPVDVARPGAAAADSVDDLMSDLQRIMASLDAQRRAETPPQTTSAAVPPVASAMGDDTQPLGNVAAAALRAFRDAETTARNSSFGARLLAEEAARIAAERRNAPQPTVPQAPDAPPGEMLLAAPSSGSDEPYVYAAGEPVAPPVNVAVARPLAEPASPQRDSIRERDSVEDFVPARHRAAAAAPAVAAAKAGEEGFAFDINAFVDELEREAEDAGREWSSRDGEAMFAGGLTSVDAQDTLPPTASTAAPASDASTSPDIAMPHVEAAIARALAIDEEAEAFSLASWQPELKEPPVPVVTPPSARRARTDSFTWKRFALLGLCVVGAIGAGVALQSVAARNDRGAVEPTGNAEVASVAAQGDAAELRGATSDAARPVQPSVRVIAPKSADQVAPSDDAAPADADAPSAARAASDQPAEPPMDPALAADGRDASSVATPEGAAPGAQFAAVSGTDAQASATPEGAVPEASATVGEGDDAQSADAQPVDAGPAAATPLPKPQLAAASSAPRAPIQGVSNAPPTGSATIKSGVTLRGAADNKAASLATLKTGQKVDLVSCKMWCEIIADGKRGFVFKKFVEATAPAQ